MGIDLLQTVDIIEIMENYIEKKRPPEHLRKELDISYKIEGQSIMIFEIRPIYMRPEEFQECNIAKTTYVKTQEAWKIFWMRANLKWVIYEPRPSVKTFKEVVEIIDKDECGCFWG